MKKFFLKFSLFILPCFLGVLAALYLDFFKVFKEYSTYAEPSFLFLNREFICLKTLQKQAVEERANSFVFGSSRSQAFKCNDWANYLEEDAVPFHFDASNESLIGVVQKLRYLEENDYDINNVLLITDIHLLSQTNMDNRNTHITVSHHDLTQESKFKFYIPFLKSSLNPKFLFAYTDFSVFGVPRNYMRAYFSQSIHQNILEPNTMDIYYGWDKEIELDSASYFNNRINEGVFYDRSSQKVKEPVLFNIDAIELLKEIQEVIIRNNTSFKIVVSPNYDQVNLPEEYADNLNSIFQEENVYDFSGINNYTEDIYNFYESSHYRPILAREIMDTIYSY